MSREAILGRVRAALGRQVGEPVQDPPAVRLRIPAMDLEARVASMQTRLEALAGRLHRVSEPAGAGDLVRQLLGGRSAVASEAPYLEDCGVTRLPGVRSGIRDREDLRDLCAAADVGITSADYALADTGTLVLLATAA
ncbi:MAG TPA: LUD domain-containing protein, partial [Bryobacteraceae bacterium]|nr:LUD domain-containing protein [Bryobacteraceae bacterium]